MPELTKVRLALRHGEEGHATPFCSHFSLLLLLVVLVLLKPFHAQLGQQALCSASTTGNLGTTLSLNLAPISPKLVGTAAARCSDHHQQHLSLRADLVSCASQLSASSCCSCGFGRQVNESADSLQHSWRLSPTPGHLCRSNFLALRSQTGGGSERSGAPTTSARPLSVLTHTSTCS